VLKSLLPEESQAATGWLTLPLLLQEQLGLQQSQYPVTHVPVIHSPEVCTTAIMIAAKFDLSIVSLAKVLRIVTPAI